MIATIHQPPKSAMQSGAGSQQWLLEFAPTAKQKIEPTMAYTSTTDTTRQIRLTFPTSEAAIEYAKLQNIAYRLIEKKSPPRKKISYSDNFNYNKKIAWTH